MLVNCVDFFLYYRFCGIRDPSPSWHELQNFVFFFNKQLEDYEVNVFASEEDFPGFKTFIVRFLLLMSKVYLQPS